MIGPGTRGVLVVGSVNRDRVLRVAQRPGPGDTVLANRMELRTGGKGANQAIAAAHAGAATRFIGCVGDDADGRAAIRDLMSAGVDTSGVAVVDGVPSGSAFITVTPDGENAIVVEPGTNALLRPIDAHAAVVSMHARGLAERVVVTQAEVPEAVIERVAAAAEASSVRFVHNLAPYRVLGESILRMCDPLVLNEGEASELVGEPLGSISLASAAAGKLARACRSVVLTLGPSGAVLSDHRGVRQVPAIPVADVVETTGAGDAFVGTMAAALARGADLDAAVTSGVHAAAAVIGGNRLLI